MRRKSVTTEMMKSFIVESLLLLLEERSLAEITVSDIVQKAGVNRSTFYRHFERKEDVILYFLHCLSEDILRWDKEQKPDFREHLVNVYQHFYNHKTQMMVIYKSDLSFLFLDILRNSLGVIDNDDKTIDMQYNIAYHIGGTFNHLMLWFSRGMADTPEEMADHTLAALPEEMIEHMWITATEQRADAQEKQTIDQ